MYRCWFHKWLQKYLLFHIFFLPYVFGTPFIEALYSFPLNVGRFVTTTEELIMIFKTRLDMEIWWHIVFSEINTKDKIDYLSLLEL
jgi:hypothetical protein